jgi:carbamoyltransferase
MRILAFNTTHDSSVCCVNNGDIEFFCKEERLTRIKRDNNPFKSLDLFKSQNTKPIDHILFCTPSNREGDVQYIYDQYIRKLFNVEMENFSFLTHHLCHASSAFYNSGFKQALSFVIDRNGSIVFNNNTDSCREAESVFICSYPDDIKPIYKSFWTNNLIAIDKDNLKIHLKNIYPSIDINIDNEYSITKVYEAATTLIGQNILENGKTMGLSSYGLNKKYESLFLNGNPITNYFNHSYKDNDNVVTFNGLEDKITNYITQENYQFYADKAKHVQLETQRETLTLIKKYVEKTKITNVCISGGYGLNVVANNFYIKNLPNVNFYFEPLSDDTGISIGAAYLKYRNVTKDNKIKTPKNNFYHYYKDTKINKGTKASIKDICKLLNNQKSVAIFEGCAEAGPRALGHRSILFDARNKDCKNLVNKIKNREWYRPFAGVILKEHFKKYFNTLGLNESKDMTINFECHKDTLKLVPGIVHVDKTCRVQTVESGFMYQLLTEFNKLTKCPMLLNTSLNLAGQPLVNTKEEACELLNNSKLDAIYFVDDKKILYRK